MPRSPTLMSLTAGLLVVSAIFWILERRHPSLPDQRRTRGETRLDLTYWFFTPLVTRAATRIALGIVFIALAASQGITLDQLRRAAASRQTWAASLPLWVQVPLVLLLADLLAYWSHRLF